MDSDEYFRGWSIHFLEVHHSKRGTVSSCSTAMTDVLHELVGIGTRLLTTSNVP